MQDAGDIDDAKNASGVGQEDKDEWNNIPPMTRRAITVWIVILFGGIMAFVAHDYVNEHSASIKFFSEAMFSFMALLVIVEQVRIYNQQRKLMQQQVENAAVSERAYIGIDKMVFIGPLTVGKPPTVRVIFINGGRTPAWGFQSYVRMVISRESIEEALKEYPVVVPESEGVSFLPAGISKRVEYPMLDFEVTPERLMIINAKLAHLFVYGEAHYRDFRKEKHVFPFRVIYDPVEGGFQDADDQELASAADVASDPEWIQWAIQKKAEREQQSGG